MREEEALQLTISRCRGFAETGEAFWGPAYAFRGGGTGDQDALLRSLNEISGQRIQNALEGFVEDEFFTGAAMRGIDLRVDFAKKRNFLAQNGEIQKLGFESIVDIGRVVGDFIDPVDELRFEGRAQIEEVFGKLGKFRGGIITRMLDDAFANFKGEIQAGKIKVALLELFDDTKRVQIVIETAALRAHQFVELAFAGMAEWRMADVVNESERFGKLSVQFQSGGDGPGNLRNFQRVRQAIAEMVRVARGENLRLGFEAAKSAGMNDAVAVTRVGTAVRMGRLGVAPAAGLFRAHRPGS